MDAIQKRKLIQLFAAILLISCLIYVVIQFSSTSFGWFILLGVIFWVIAQFRSERD